MWVIHVLHESKDEADTPRRSWSWSKGWVFRVTQLGPPRVKFMLIKWGLGDLQTPYCSLAPYWDFTKHPVASQMIISVSPVRLLICYHSEKGPQPSSLCTRGLFLSPLNSYFFNFWNFESSLLLRYDLLLTHLFKGIYWAPTMFRTEW